MHGEGLIRVGRIRVFITNHYGPDAPDDDVYEAIARDPDTALRAGYILLDPNRRYDIRTSPNISTVAPAYQQFVKEFAQVLAKTAQQVPVTPTDDDL